MSGSFFHETRGELDVQGVRIDRKGRMRVRRPRTWREWRRWLGMSMSSRHPKRFLP